jgi:hypothetical protein
MNYNGYPGGKRFFDWGEHDTDKQAEGTPTKSAVPNSSRRPRRLLQLKLELTSDVLGPSAS